MKTTMFILLAMLFGGAVEATLSPADKACIETVTVANSNLRRFQLDNGLVGLVKRDPAAPLVAVQIWVGCGSNYEGKWLGGGLSHGLEHMVFKGTPTYPGNTFTKLLNEAGGRLNAYTANDRTVYHVTLPASSWKLGIDTLSDAVMNCSLPAETWKTEQDVILREFAMGEDEPDRMLFHAGMAQLYRSHPLRVPIIGYADVFKSMTAQDLRDYHDLHYTPDNMIAVVVGDIDPDQVEQALRAAFAQAKRRPRPPQIFPEEPTIVSPRTVRKTGAYEQGRLFRGWHTVPKTHPDAPALDVLAAWLSAGRSGRLTERLREQRQLALDIGSFNDTTRENGYFGIVAEFEPTKEAALLEALDAEIETWTRERIASDELARVRRQFVVGQLGQLESMDGQAGAHASDEYACGDPRATERYLAAVLAVTPDDVRDVARRYLKPAAYAQAVLAPALPAATNTATAGQTSAGRPERLDILGVPVIIRTDARLPIVHVVAAFRGGPLTETPETSGLTAYAAELLTRGSQRYDRAAIDRAFEARGAGIGAFSGQNSLGLSFSALAPDVETLLPIFVDCLARPAFPADECAKLLDLQKASVLAQREEPQWVAFDQLRRTLFPGHPYSLDPAGTPESVAAFTPQAARAQATRLLSRRNMTLAIFGAVTREQAIAIAQTCLKSLPDTPAPTFAGAPTGQPTAEAVTAREPRQQAVIFLGWRGAKLGTPEADEQSLLATILSGMSSDLFMRAREQRGLAYYVSASQTAWTEGGTFILFAGTQAANVGLVEELMRDEIRRLAEKGPRADELHRAVETLCAASDSLPQSNGGFAQNAALMELLGLGFDHALATRSRLEKIDAGRIRAAAARFASAPGVRSLVLPEEPAEKGAPTKKAD